MKIIKNPEFTHTIKVKSPVDGGHKEETFKARFRMLPVSRVKEVERDAENADNVRAFLLEALVGADDIVGEDDAPLIWNDELRDYLVDMPHTRTALYLGYFAAFSLAKAGN